MQRGKNRLRLAKVIVENKMSRFFMVYCVVFAKSIRLELEDNILRTL